MYILKRKNLNDQLKVMKTQKYKCKKQPNNDKNNRKKIKLKFRKKLQSEINFLLCPHATKDSLDSLAPFSNEADLEQVRFIITA